jgi:dUTP pyrophosphatase
MVPVVFSRLYPDVQLPSYGSIDAIGMDLCAYHPYTPILLHPNQRALIRTGLMVAFPCGYYARVAPRSGIAVNHGIDVLAGVIDPDYRGEVGVVLINHGNGSFQVDHGARIAQLIMERAERATIEQTDPATFHGLYVSQRGFGGFGSTGM